MKKYLLYIIFGINLFALEGSFGLGTISIKGMKGL